MFFLLPTDSAQEAYINRAADEPRSFCNPLLGSASILIHYSEKEHTFFEALTAKNVDSIITLIREGILPIPSEEATALAHEVKSQVIAEILGKPYNNHNPSTHYNEEKRKELLGECAQANSKLRQFSDIPTTWCLWKKKKQTRSSQTLQAAAEEARIEWENSRTNTQTASSSASSSSSSFFSSQEREVCAAVPRT